MNFLKRFVNARDILSFLAFCFSSPLFVATFSRGDDYHRFPAGYASISRLTRMLDVE